MHLRVRCDDEAIVASELLLLPSCNALPNGAAIDVRANRRLSGQEGGRGVVIIASLIVQVVGGQDTLAVCDELLVLQSSSESFSYSSYSSSSSQSGWDTAAKWVAVAR